MRSDQFDWIRDSGGTTSSFTGPDRDRLGSLSGRLKKNIFNPQSQTIALNYYIYWTNCFNLLCTSN